MRNPRTDPRKGDVLEHLNGEKRAVVAIYRDSLTVHYRAGKAMAECSQAQWREWARETSIVDLG